MRLWSLHPEFLDRVALVAAWRESLLAQKVLAGRTRGYTRHPQLERFNSVNDPISAIGHYLGRIQQEAAVRNYNFNKALILFPNAPNPAIHVSAGQLQFELDHLRAKVRIREPRWEPRLEQPLRAIESFIVISGPIASWERP